MVELVKYNGVLMVKGWPEKIQQAQLEETLIIAGVRHKRVRYGDEESDWGADDGPCHDCAVIKGQFHVVGCDVERCPACGWQAIFCDCNRKLAAVAKQDKKSRNK